MKCHQNRHKSLPKKRQYERLVRARGKRSCNGARAGPAVRVRLVAVVVLLVDSPRSARGRGGTVVAVAGCGELHKALSRLYRSQKFASCTK